jgi:GDPmannose 4,6-dehydratase
VSTAATALVTGISGQDGSFLAELLIDRGYHVAGLVHGRDEEAVAAAPLGASEHLRDQLELVAGELLEPESLRRAIERLAPREIYHLAAPSYVPASWQRPGETMRAIVGSCAAILETVRDAGAGTRVFVAASGAMFGEAPESPQSELTPCRPTTPYAIAKLSAHQLVGVLRGHGDVHASSGILFNHESERRPEQFVTRRITRGAAAIALGLQDELTLGALDAVRDWSFAGDIMHAAWLMLQQDRPDDYVLASGTARTVRDFADAAFASVDLDAERYLSVDPELVRAPETTVSVGDPGRARERLGWRAAVGFDQLVERMVRADLAALEAGPVPGTS